MNDVLADPDENSTDFTTDELTGLIPSYITSRNELNAAEQKSILTATLWAFKRKRDVLDIVFLCLLHRRMFKSVWKWAGRFRETSRNIGVDAWNIAQELRKLTEDATFWIENQTYATHEIVARFHHRLVWIHPFPNGNGRLSRLAADLLAVNLGLKPSKWGEGSLLTPGAVRQKYIEALRSADRNIIEPLVDFIAIEPPVSRAKPE